MAIKTNIDSNQIYNGDQRLRVYNRTYYTIHVKTLMGINVQIFPQSFQLLTVNDIVYIESMCTNKPVFSAGLLVAVDERGNDVPLQRLGLYAVQTCKHLTDDDIKAGLKFTGKKFENWIDSITDQLELTEVYIAAKKSDVAVSKLEYIKSKMPEALMNNIDV